ncbi:hypothetical protein KYG33_05335 [Chryseobacterium sp. D764]|uniref:hypothetical protein n=1 Tax=unclassified Chryseobacterium TaxID=2593645 RepID=UPI001C58080B|nr:hypothetical protein [Chryseobacterium sp. D764]QXU50468.1 hypothetical protein KYG33_05335 [Chryseobacterium sp. D764]
MDFFKKYYPVILFFLIIAIICFDFSLRQNLKKNYKNQGEYAIGKINSIKGYGRGTGFYFLYSFKVGNKNYKGRSTTDLSFSEAEKNIGKRFLVLYLKHNIYNNILYVSIPVNDSIKSNLELHRWVSRYPVIQSKLDSIPGSGFFFENYF